MNTSHPAPLPDLIAHRLDSVENITVIDMREVADYTEYFLVGTVANRRAMSEAVQALREIADDSGCEWRIERADKWTLVDLGSCVVHLFTKAGRREWRLEQLWGMAPQHEVAIQRALALA